MPAAKYRVQVWDATGTGFAPGNLLAEFENAKNVGWADYLNDVPEAFFTINQDDPKTAVLRAHKDDPCHVLVYRDDDLVHGGLMGEWDANEDDVIVFSYGYLAVLFLLVTAWNLEYTNAQIDTIVSDAWTRAKTTLTSSLVAWVTTGTIEAPATTSGGSTAIVLPTYRLFYKRILFVLRELAALAVGNTTNSPVFEITPSGTFNFWKNRGVARDLLWTYGDGKVQGYHENNAPIHRRNDLLTVGMNPNDVLLRREVDNSSDITAKGRRQEPLFFSWVRDSTELERAGDFRAALSIRGSIDLTVRFYPNRLVPAGATGAGFALADTVNLHIVRGVTDVEDAFQVIGQQVYWIRGQERVRVLVQELPGA